MGPEEKNGNLAKNNPAEVSDDNSFFLFNQNRDSDFFLFNEDENSAEKEEKQEKKEPENQFGQSRDSEFYLFNEEENGLEQKDRKEPENKKAKRSQMEEILDADDEVLFGEDGNQPEKMEFDGVQGAEDLDMDELDDDVVIGFGEQPKRKNPLEFFKDDNVDIDNYFSFADVAENETIVQEKEPEVKKPPAVEAQAEQSVDFENNHFDFGDLPEHETFIKEEEPEVKEPSVEQSQAEQSIDFANNQVSFTNLTEQETFIKEEEPEAADKNGEPEMKYTPGGSVLGDQDYTENPYRRNEERKYAYTPDGSEPENQKYMENPYRRNEEKKYAYTPDGSEPENQEYMENPYRRDGEKKYTNTPDGSEPENQEYMENPYRRDGEKKYTNTPDGSALESQGPIENPYRSDSVKKEEKIEQSVSFEDSELDLDKLPERETIYDLDQLPERETIYIDKAPEAEKSQAEKSQAEKPQAEKSQAEKPQAEKSQIEKSQANLSKLHRMRSNAEDLDFQLRVQMREKRGTFLSSTNTPEHEDMVNKQRDLQYKMRLMTGDPVPNLSDEDMQRLSNASYGDLLKEARASTYEYMRKKSNDGVKQKFSHDVGRDRFDAADKSLDIMDKMMDDLKLRSPAQKLMDDAEREMMKAGPGDERKVRDCATKVLFAYSMLNNPEEFTPETQEKALNEKNLKKHMKIIQKSPAFAQMMRKEGAKNVVKRIVKDPDKLFDSYRAAELKVREAQEKASQKHVEKKAEKNAPERGNITEL